MEDYLRRAEHVMQAINQLAAISEDEGCTTRTYGSGAFMKGRNFVEECMKKAGLEIWVDQVGNLRSVLPVNNTTSKTLVIASHIDTVRNAGKFDGPLGVLIGIDVLQNLAARNISLPFNIELIAFCDEEGVRFHTSYLGSKAVAGSFNNELLIRKDGDGISLQQAIENMGGNIHKIEQDVLPKEKLIGYFEIHIEQGPVLYEKNIPVGVVTAIAGQQRFEMVFNGMPGHAGTVPMHMRADSLCAAAECILAIEQYGLAAKNELVATVGKLYISHAASNVIPGSVTCSADIRSADEVILSLACTDIEKQCADICKKRHIGFEWKPVQKSGPVYCNSVLTNLLCKAVEKQKLPLVKLVSGAGHDAVPVSEVCGVSMLFVRCYKGVSHNPMENVELQDIAAAIETAEQFIILLAEHERGLANTF